MIETTNETRMLGIFGNPVGHTISPQMHSYMAKKCGFDMAYLPFNVLPENLGDAIKGAKELNVLGLNITIPHKVEVLKFLDVISSDALKINSVNTVVNKDGVLYGYNTDGDGFCDSLEEEGVCVDNKNILMIGAGGAARAICYKMAERGAKAISVAGRNAEKIHSLGDMVEKYTQARFYDAYSKTQDYDIIINTTPLGMHPEIDKNPCAFMDIINENTTCVDIIYNPKQTLFLKEAQNMGAKVVNGLGMLVLQGILAFEKFWDVELPKKEYYNELMDLFKLYRI